MSVVESSLPGVLRERASFQPNDKALTFIDYERSWDGVEETLTWSQLYRRTLNLAAQLREHGSTGDRALILAPQSLDYVVSFIASLQAGIVAVPLSIPQGGAHDERIPHRRSFSRRPRSSTMSSNTSSRSPAKTHRR